MKNVDNNDVEPVTNLRLSVAQFHQCNPTRLSDSGAGVNAASRVDLAFVASDPLSELVWSPHNGVSLKCADSSFAESIPSLLRSASGLSHMALSLPQGITSEGTSCEKHPIDKGKLISSQMAFHVEGEVGKGSSFVRSPRSISRMKPEFGASHGYNEGISDNMELQKVENTGTTDWKGQCSPSNIQANFTAETRENSAGQKKQITAFVPLKTDELKHDIAQTEPLLSSEQNEQVMMTDASSRNEDFSLLNEEQSRNESNKDGFPSEPPPEKLESRAENDLQFLIHKQVRSEASPKNSGTRLDRRKRKEKAFSDGDFNERMSNDEENNHESVESCNSAGPTGVFSTRNEQQQLIVGNKRAKKQVEVEEGLGSKSFIGKDSSFMNWISNMVKGLNKTYQDEAPSLALTFAHRNNDPKSTNVGFQSIFQSICCTNTKEHHETKTSNSSKTLSANIVADPETCRISSCSDQNRTSLNLASNSAKEGNENVDSSPAAEANLINPLRSFWITRFSPKTHPPMLNSNVREWNINATLESSTDSARKLIPSTCNLIDQKSPDAKENSSEDLVIFTGKELQKYAPDTEASFGFKRVSGNSAQKSTFKTNPSLSSPEVKNSEAMAPVFARRLDALKHIAPPDAEDNTIRKMATCFYCGRSGHVLRDCLEITEIEKENLIRNECLYDGSEESPCFCIRCFQLDHWAISCPVVPVTTYINSRVPDARTNCGGENYRPDISKHVGSSSVDYALKEKLITPLRNVVKRKFSDVPKGVFNAIRKLRLSRTDVLKMNSHTSSLHLDGFFVRLRLGKWEEGLGGTGYYVACITEEQREKSPQGSKKPISVNIGGIRCLVETQYISNQDFLEDELMAWWCATLKSGDEVPSEDHVKSKLEERKRLGF